LYVVDDNVDDDGLIDDGWALTIVTQPPVVETPPILSVSRSGTDVVLRWSAAATGYVVVAKSVLDPALAWNPIANPVTTSNGTNSVTVAASSGIRFFRLRK
jgi:hypothetical protein